MPRKYETYAPQTIDEMLDHLAMMLVYGPTCNDESGYFPLRNIDTVFAALNKGLENIRRGLGEPRYAALRSLSSELRERFDADAARGQPSAMGSELIHKMEDILTSAPAS